MDIVLKIMAAIALSIITVLFVWGFILFYRLTDDTRKQNMMLFSILQKLENSISHSKNL